MALTRDNLVLRARQSADAVDSDRWDDTTEVLPLADMIFQREWEWLLNAAPNYRMGIRTVTSNSDGTITRAMTNITDQDTYRFLSVQRDGTLLAELSVKEAPLYVTAYQTADIRAWVPFGDGIMVFPAQAAEHKIIVNHIPPSPSTLDGGDPVDFPSGSEMILVFELAAELLVKGGAQPEAAGLMRDRAMVLRQNLYSKAARISGGPQVIATSDAAWEWGGN